MVFSTWSLQRRWQRLQRPLAAALVSLGAFLLWGQARADPPSAPTVVAVADVPAGQMLQASDVQLVQWPVANRPPAAARSPDEVVGRRTTAAITAGEPLTPARVTSPGALSAVGADQVAVMLTQDPLAASGLVRPGDRVNVVGQTQAGSRTLVTGATVLSVTDDSGLILAVPATLAGPVVQAAVSKSASAVLRSD